MLQPGTPCDNFVVTLLRLCLHFSMPTRRHVRVHAHAVNHKDAPRFQSNLRQERRRVFHSGAIPDGGMWEILHPSAIRSLSLTGRTQI